MLHLRLPGGGFAIEGEAVQHGQPQIRHSQSAADQLALLDIRNLEGGASLVVQDDIPGQAAWPRGVRAQMLAPLWRDGRLAGIVALHDCVEPRRWNARDQDAMREAQSKILVFLERARPESSEQLRSAAIQAILDRLRLALDVQRCTFRQPVQQAYAFPVTFESRDAQVRSLLGDFTIVQTGQPVIVKLLADRAQVIQEDCVTASPDSLFRKMLAHYGGMRAQMVTPFIVHDELKGVLSVHELCDARVWTAAEKALAADAAALIGAISETRRD
jgi:GAF domain-containing protein